MSVKIDMDMPKCCDDCRLCTYYGNGFGDCRLTGIEMNRNAAKVRHPDCPLREIKAVVIPENPTNGDVIKALFHCLEKYEYEEPYTHGIALVGNDNRVTWFTNDWWNAPYKER